MQSTNQGHVEQRLLHHPSLFRERKSDICYAASYNKGTAFTAEEREAFHLRGLLPPAIENLEQQVSRALSQLRAFDTNIEKYIFLQSLQCRSETLFYRLLLNNLEETMPIVYTPTVGEACQKFGSNFRATQGMYFSNLDRGHIRRMLDNWIHDSVNIIVVTDGSRILGLGDLGAGGMGIPIGKLSLYVAGAGFHPCGTLPITLDIGTNREELLAADHYLGLRHKRINGEEYYGLLDEFVEAVFDKWPGVLLQFEDFSNDHAFDLLAKYRDKHLCFNDDIQGTGAVVTSGFINSLKVAGIAPKDVRAVFYGAGSAGVGVADQIVHLLVNQGFELEDARSRFWFVDSRGLVTMNRGDHLEEHKIRFARKDTDIKISGLKDIIAHVKPNILIGLSGQGGSFNQEVIAEFTKYNERPIIFSLSNPTSAAECTAKQAYEWTDGKAIFASGSPFAPVQHNGQTFVPGQGNNMFIFPGLGFGAWLAQSRVVSDDMILTAAKVLADFVSDEEISQGKIYPHISKIRDISTNIAAAVFETAHREGIAKTPVPEGDLKNWVRNQMYIPEYIS